MKTLKRRGPGNTHLDEMEILVTGTLNRTSRLINKPPPVFATNILAFSTLINGVAFSHTPHGRLA